MKLFLLVLGIAIGLAILNFAIALSIEKRHQVEECNRWRAATGEQVRMTSHGCYVREGNQFVSLAQRKLDASIQAAQ